MLSSLTLIPGLILDGRMMVVGAVVDKGLRRRTPGKGSWGCFLMPNNNHNLKKEKKTS